MQGKEQRKYWVEILTKVAEPVLRGLAEEKLKETMPIEQKIDDRYKYTYLEALGRTINGIAPWLQCGVIDGEEGKLRERFCKLSRKAIANAVDPNSKDYVNFIEGYQPIVDTAFLAHGILRAPIELWDKLDYKTKKNVIAAFKLTRDRKPFFNNWLLFSAMIETFLYKVGEVWDPMRIDYAIKQHMQWYKGDGVFGDGPDFRFDYYNSFVIQPMLIDILHTVGNEYNEWKELKETSLKISRRYAQIQERFISPEGTLPVIGRSIVYRTGCMQLLSQMALQHNLPKDIKPAQIRCALTSVTKRLMEASGTFDEKGWLQLGFCGHQQGLAEEYISTGSLYLCTTGWVALGLKPEDEFWSGEECNWTSKKVYNGENLDADKSLIM